MGIARLAISGAASIVVRELVLQEGRSTSDLVVMSVSLLSRLLLEQMFAMIVEWVNAADMSPFVVRKKNDSIDSSEREQRPRGSIATFFDRRLFLPEGMPGKDIGWLTRSLC
jgi:hypothetical protein